jgi:uncharacterized protein YidB (DUF937 family)
MPDESKAEQVNVVTESGSERKTSAPELSASLPQMTDRLTLNGVAPT